MPIDETKVEFQVSTVEATRLDTITVTSAPFTGNVSDATVVLRSINMKFDGVNSDHPLKRFIFNITNIVPVGNLVNYDIEPTIKDKGSIYMEGTVETLIIATIG